VRVIPKPPGDQAVGSTGRPRSVAPATLDASVGRPDD
jgi:hypothetical protein